MTISVRRIRSVSVDTYPLKSRASKARVEDFARADAARRDDRRASSTRCPTSSPPPISRPSSRAIADAKRGAAGVVWGLGAHVIKTGSARC